MPIKKPCTCGARSNKRCPLHSFVPRRRIYQRLRQPSKRTGVKKWGGRLTAILAVLNVGAALLKVLHLIVFW